MYELETQLIEKHTQIPAEKAMIIMPHCAVMQLELQTVVYALVFTKGYWNGNGMHAIITLRNFLSQWAQRDGARAWHKKRINRIKYKLFRQWRTYPDPNTDFRPTVRLPLPIIEYLGWLFGIMPVKPPVHPNCRCTITDIQENQPIIEQNQHKKRELNTKPVRWECPECRYVMTSDPKQRHKMDTCKCGKTSVDLEEHYCRVTGDPIWLDK